MSSFFCSDWIRPHTWVSNQRAIHSQRQCSRSIANTQHSCLPLCFQRLITAVTAVISERSVEQPLLQHPHSALRSCLILDSASAEKAELLQLCFRRAFELDDFRHQGGGDVTLCDQWTGAREKQWRTRKTRVHTITQVTHLGRWLLPLQICTMPMMMIRMRASSFPAVNTSCTRVAQRTLEQFTQVSSTKTGRGQKADVKKTQVHVRFSYFLKKNLEQYWIKKEHVTIKSGWGLCVLRSAAFCLYY